MSQIISYINLEEKCVKEIIPELKEGYERITLFNVNKFKSVCDISGNNRQFGIHPEKFIEYLKSTNSTILFLIDVLPDFTETLKKENYIYLMELSQDFKYFFIADRKVEKDYLPNAIFSKHESSKDIIHVICDITILNNNNKIVLEAPVGPLLKDKSSITNDFNKKIVSESKIKINGITVILLLTQFHYETGPKYESNINKTIDIIKKIKARNDKYIILGGNFNNLREKCKEIETVLLYINPKTSKTTFTSFAKDGIVDYFYISEEFMRDFDFTVSIVKNNLSNHYPVIMDFKYVNT